MASRSRLFTRSRARNTTNTIKKISVVIFDIDVNDIMINDPTIELKIFNEQEQFQDDRNTLKNQYYSEESTFENVNLESAEILCWMTFDKILQHIRHTDIAKDELTAFWREFSQDDRVYELKQIEEFYATYTSDKAICCYTREDFLCDLLKKTLRTKKKP